MGALRLLDLFCCAGGAGRGYADAGFEVVGVDIEPQPRYPFEFIRADALALPVDFLRTFDAIHASPPCQGYSAMRHAPGGKRRPRLIGATRTLLEAAGVPWVIENVEDARSEMRSPVMLCGTSFGLGTQGFDLQRHRLFETSFPLTAPPCEHSDRPVVGVYGGHARNRSAKHGGRGTRDVWEGGHKTACREAMGIDWMTLDQISEAIPPAYTRFIGERLRDALPAPTRKEGELYI